MSASIWFCYKNPSRRKLTYFKTRRKKLAKCCIWSVAVCSPETWTLRKVDQKHLESFEMWCWGRMEKINWDERVRNEEVLQKSMREGTSYIQ
jgi:hypothetical protein